MLVFVVAAAAFALVGTVMVSLERHHRLTPFMALFAALGTLAIVLGITAAAITSVDPATADVVPRGVTDNQQPERVTDVELPTL